MATALKEKSKFVVMAEVLPLNERTATILKGREEIRLQNEATAKAVSCEWRLLCYYYVLRFQFLRSNKYLCLL